MTEPIRIAISGAGGQIGYALVFRIAAGGLFGADQPITLALLEANERHDLVESIRMELTDCAFPLLKEVKIGTDPFEVFAGADWVVLLGGKPWQSPGQQRLDLLRENGPIYVEQGRAINEACPNARILVVANPCNTNAMIARMHAPDVPAEHWFAMNRLDRMRATALIAETAGVPLNQVSRMTIWGNHSEKVFPDFHNAYVGNRPAREVITDPGWPRQVLEPFVARRSLEVIRLRGASPSGSAAQAILGTIRAITTPTPFERRFGAAVVSDGSYGVPRGLIFGFPLRTEDGVSWEIVEGLYLDNYAQGRIAQNVEELEREAAIVTDLLSHV